MNDPFEKQLEQVLHESVTELSGDERTRMRTLLADYAAFKPVRTAAAPARVLHLFTRPAFAGAFAALLIITLSGGAAYAAEGAVPGDLFYGVKVDVTEPVVTALTPAGSAEAAWQLTIAKRRLKEAALLSAEGRLASSTEAMLSARAADAILKSALDATALEHGGAVASATTTASTTEALVRASSLILKGRGQLEDHQNENATKAFRAAIRTSAQVNVNALHALGTLNLGDDEGADDASTSPGIEGDATMTATTTSSTTGATTGDDQSSAALEGLLHVRLEGRSSTSERTRTTSVPSRSSEREGE